MRGQPELIELQECVELWRLRHLTDAVAGTFTVKDPSRTPEQWWFGDHEEGSARAKFDERVRIAKKG